VASLTLAPTLRAAIQEEQLQPRGRGFAGWRRRPDSARARLERLGAIVARPVVVEPHRHTSELPRRDCGTASTGGRDAALESVVEAGLRAAVLAPEREVRTWFSWPVRKRRSTGSSPKGGPCA